MRNSFVDNLVAAASCNKDIYLLCGDLGYGVLDKFAEQFPERFINVGIAEQNMTGMAAGLAMSGKKVFTYSIVNFAIARCLEQIRNDICYHNLDVTIVAVGGGLPYGTHGYTHLGVEDVSFIRSLPNINTYIPADRYELKHAMAQILGANKPTYLRLARGGEADIHNTAITSNLIAVLPEQKINFICSGTVLEEACEAAKLLKVKNIEVGILSLMSPDPQLASSIREISARTKALISVEEHITYGGIGSFIAESISSLGKHAKLVRCGIEHNKLNHTGSQKFLRKANNIDAASLVKIVEYL
ncbi:transketolase family protein [Candidatus Enterovibrio escicola]|uniref:transketolase family protein n=1 Tax=Candidatus Enterovibrio escicola TaxID=1927127 RepID=UPI001238176B|nr:transketolase C-terminal domain-containing protein [Candidatus Enterovibrio escacola]